MDISGLNKGDDVIVHAIAFTKQRPLHIYGEEEIVREVPAKCKNHCDSARPLVKVKVDPFNAIVIGYTFRISGTYHMGYNDPEGFLDLDEDAPVERNGWIEDAVWHKVLLVEPTNSQRWTAPFTALPEDCHRVGLANASMAHVIIKQQEQIKELEEQLAAIPDPGDHDS